MYIGPTGHIYRNVFVTIEKWQFLKKINPFAFYRIQDNWAPGQLGLQKIGPIDIWAPGQFGPWTFGPQDNSAQTYSTVCAPRYARRDSFYCFSPGEPHLELWAGTAAYGKLLGSLGWIVQGPKCPGAQLSRGQNVRGPNCPGPNCPGGPNGLSTLYIYLCLAHGHFCLGQLGP